VEFAIGADQLQEAGARQEACYMLKELVRERKERHDRSEAARQRQYYRTWRYA
jgi:hypothetical protein